MIRRGDPIKARHINQTTARASRAVLAGPGVRRIQVGESVSLTSATSAEQTVQGARSVIAVPFLPPVPTSGTVRAVLWCSAADWDEYKPSGNTETGTADVTQVWEAWPLSQRWYPRSGVFTDSTGVVV